MPNDAITVEGGLFPAELLDDIAAGTGGVQGAVGGARDSHRLTDDIQSAFSDARVYWDGYQRRLGRSEESRYTTLTRQDWMLKFLELVGFTHLPFQRTALEAGGQSYSISHRAGDYDNAPPVHIVGSDQGLDQRENTGRRISPHGLVQEYLNRAEPLWGLVTNGNQLRLLRDTARLSKPTYLEFNLQGMMEGNQYSEFALLYRLIHSSHFPQPEANPNECVLEKYYQEGLDQGGRVRDGLRKGVHDSLIELGTAFLRHPESEVLRQKLEGGQLDSLGYYRQLLRLVYRLLFLMVAEERHLIFPEEATVNAEQRVYRDYYSIGKLRERAERYFRGDRNSDLWLGLKETFGLFRDNASAQKLGLAALDGELFGPRGCPDLESAQCTNEELLAAVRHLSTFLDDGGNPRRRGRGRRAGAEIRRRVNYAGLDVEELGSVYESLLDHLPVRTLDPPEFNLVKGGERKQTGSYYTPPELVKELINSALVPVIEDRLEALSTKGEMEAGLLSLKVCDPASGSGHFLLAAARHIARELAQVRTEEPEPAPTAYRQALRDVIRNCIYAVDKNPLAVDLCKVALWIEGHNAGLPLSFLDNRIKVGDSLVGVFDLAVLAQGIPDDAYKPVTGDDKTAARSYQRKNKEERQGQLRMDLGSEAILQGNLAGDFQDLATYEELTPDDVQFKEELYSSLRGQGSKWLDMKVACDLWTAAFFLPLQQEDGFSRETIPTSGTVRRYLAQPESGYGPLVGKVVEASQKHPYFHWPLEFPEVFDGGGFDVVLGNPPWERVKLQEQEFFGARDQDIAKAPNAAARKRLIEQLPKTNPSLAVEFADAKHDAEATSKFARAGGRFPLGGRGDINTYAVFAEQFRSLMNPRGRAGIIVPSGIATDDTTKHFFQNLVEERILVSLYSFFEVRKLFPDTDSRSPFCLLTITGKDRPSQDYEFAFSLDNAEQLRDTELRFQLTGDDFALFNPNTRTCPIFRTKRDMEITKGIYERVPVFVDENKGEEGNPWGVSFLRMFDMANDSSLFRTREQLESDAWALEGNVFRRGRDKYLPLYEAKLVHQFDHRWATYVNDIQTRDLTSEEKADPYTSVTPRYWVTAHDVEDKLRNRWDKGWLMGWRKIARATDERTFIASILPLSGFSDSGILGFVKVDEPNLVSRLLGNLGAAVLDYVVRQKLGGTNMAHFITKQLPVLAPRYYTHEEGQSFWLSLQYMINTCVLELMHTSRETEPFAQAQGYGGLPFRWDEERRFLIRCELDAAFFHLYGISREDVFYIMDTFRLVRRKDEQAHDEYRTKRVILEIFDDMGKAMQTGRSYQTRLDPPPGDPRAAHHASTQLS